MTGRKAAVMDKVRSELLEPPHIIGALVDFIYGERNADLFRQKHLESHLVVCEYCRMAVIEVLSIAQEYERLNEQPDSSVHDLLNWFVDMQHKIKSREHEQIGAYAEAIVAFGEEEANKRFPALVEHIRICSFCRGALEETVAFLHETDMGH